MNTKAFRNRGWLCRALFLLIIGFTSSLAWATVGDGVWDADRDPNINNPPNENVDSDSVYHAVGVGGDGTPLPAHFIEAFFVDDYNPDPGNDPTLHNDGQKDGQYLKDWECNPPKSAPPKNNLVHGLATYYANASEFIFGSASKDADNGTNYLGFWLFLDPDVGCTPNYDADGNFLGANANGLFGGSHVDGDWLLISDYTNGGGVASFNAYRWNDPNYRACLNGPDMTPDTADDGSKSSCAIYLEDGDEVLGHYVFATGQCATGKGKNGGQTPIGHANAADECGPVFTSIDCNPQSPAANNVICATTNTETFGSVTAAWNVLKNNDPNGDILDPPTYFEFAINVKTLVENPPTLDPEIDYPAQEFCGGQFMIETRTSANLFNASLKDYILSDFRVCGDLKVVKQTDPTEEPPTTDFNFTVTQDPDGVPTDITNLADPSETLGDGEYFEITDLAVGDYNISEDHPLPSGWSLDDIQCVNDEEGPEGTDDGANGVDISLAAETITCTFFNVKPPKLTLVKRVVNDDGGTATVSDFSVGSDAGSFTFGGGTSDGTDTLKYTSNTLTLTDGTYSLYESDVTGYSEGTWSCDGGTGLVNTFDNGSITLANGDDVTCTITNDDIAPQLKLVKTVTNDDGGTGVPNDWTLTAGSDDDTSRDKSVAGGSDSLAAVFAGDTYTLGESSATWNGGEYTAGSWSCSGGTDDGSDGTVVLGLAEQVTCTIDNDDVAPQLKLVKTVTNDDGGTGVPNDWTLTANSGDDGSRDKSVAGGSDSLAAVFAGDTYTLGESSATWNGGEYTAGNWSCTGGSDDGSDGTVVLGLAEQVTCTIDNDDVAPKLKLVKSVVNGDPSWSTAVADDWTLTGNAANDGSRDKSVAGGSDTLTVVFANDAYTLGESGPDGYDASSWDCEDSSGDYAGQSGSSVTLGLADEVTCTITNTARGMVELLKYFNGTLVTTESFNFTLTGPESLNESDSTPPNPVDFGGAKLIPDTTYTICETGIPAGTTAYWSVDTSEPPDGTGDNDLTFVGAQSGNLWEVYNPDAPNEDLGTRCVDFQVSVGEVVNFVVDNVTPMGDARTPGYWKNWSSCSSGNQFDKAADEYWANMSGLLDVRHWTLDEILTEAYGSGRVNGVHVYDTGVYIGDLELDGDSDGNVYEGVNDADCDEAVIVLNSSDQKYTRGGKDNPINHSGDPAYKLGRYLLAFIANQTAGAYQCSLAADAAEAAQLLLDDIGFIGEGDYLDNKSIKQGNAFEEDAENAMYYHGILGQYVENDPGLNCGGTLTPPNP